MIPLRDRIPSQTFPFITIALIIINSVIYFYEVSMGSQLQSFINTFGAVPVKVLGTGNEPVPNPIMRFFPVFSSMFLHGGWLHIIGNMWYLWIFGDNIEDRLGHGRFLIFYLVCGV
ncbi:MAG: rhomboid family intramembrane serine protease, partial [Calditrichia bacterium]